MKFISLLSVAGLVIAASVQSSVSSNQGLFNGVAGGKKASPVRDMRISGSKGGLWLNLKTQNATCEGSGKPAETATFYLNSREGLYLYSTGSNKQMIYGDLTARGQGKLGYYNQNDGPPAGTLNRFILDEVDRVVLRTERFLACPNGPDGAYSIWVEVPETKEPQGIKGCLPMTFNAKFIKSSQSCRYSEFGGEEEE